MYKHFVQGVSLYKQAFSTGVRFQLMVREFACCCVNCLDGNYYDCKLKVKKEVGGPAVIYNLIFVRIMLIHRL